MEQNGGCKGVCIPMYQHGSAFPQCLCDTRQRSIGGACVPVPFPKSFLIVPEKPPRITFLPLEPNAKPLATVLQVSRPHYVAADSSRGYVYFSEDLRLDNSKII